MNKKFNALDELKEVVCLNYNKKPYFAAFEEWEEKNLNSDPALDAQLRPLYNEIMSLKEECWVGTGHRPWEPEFTFLLDIIGKREYNNSSFESMRFRLLYANKAATNTLDGDKILRYVQNVYEPIEGPIRSFGVDIKKLYNEIYDEECYIRRLVSKMN